MAALRASMKLGARPTVAARRVTPVARTRVVSVKAMAGQPFDRNWLKVDPLVLGLGFLGWTIPAASPAPSFGGNSLFGLFTESIGQELAHFPTGPALTDSFWLYLITYHIGLFLTMLLGQIGVQGRKQGYW